MNFDTLISVLGWIAVINYSVLIAWFLVFVYAKKWYYNLNSKWFSIPEDKFEVIHYCLMGVFEMFILAAFVVPYIALRIVL